ncbi:MAG: FxsA family protein [Clostridia bacterium]|nr:FxsA family protein [Clostridia bacterium]
MLVAKLLLIFTLVPILELVVLVKMGTLVGVLPTILMVGLTGFIGVFLAKTQGLRIIRRIQEQMAYGQLPGDELLDGGLILAGSLLLLTPGLITDFAGVFLLLPPSRKIIRELLKRKLWKMIQQGQTSIFFRL